MAQIVRPLLSTWLPTVAHGTLCQVVKSGVPRHLSWHSGEPLSLAVSSKPPWLRRRTAPQSG